MTTTTRSSRFGTYAMAGGRDEKPTQNMTSGFGSANLYQNIWNTSYTTKRDNSKGSEDAFPIQPSGSGALAANSEAEPWGSHPWGTTEATPQTRSTSGSTSPNRTRDGVHTGPFYDNPNPAIGQGRNFTVNGRPKSYLEDEKENTGFGASYNSPFDVDRGYKQEKRGSLDPAFLGIGAVGAPPSRDSSIPPSRQSEESHHSPTGYHEAFAYGAGHTPNNSIASGRPALPVHSSSFSSQKSGHRPFVGNNTRQLDEQDLAAHFKAGLSLEDGVLSQGLPGTAGAQPFQFNPGSQPWTADVNGASRFANGAAGEGFPDSFSTQFLPAKRGSADRYSPASSSYRVVSSPKPLTPQSQAADAWNPRPSSRDPRMVPEFERRTPVPPFIQAHGQAFYPPPYFNPTFTGQYPQQLYDPYNRAPLPIPGYGLPLHPYAVSGPSVPLRPSKDQDPGKGVRSMLLEEFRSSSKSNKRYELKDIYGHVVEFSGDQHGSRFIQQKLETANSDEKDQIFREIEPNAVQLMKDVFGNYVIQKFFEHGNQVQKKVLASQMKGKVVDLSVQMYACRVVQKALEHVLVEQQAELVKELEPDIARVVKDQNGNHVVQKIIELVPRQYIDFVMDCFRNHVSQLAAHTYGCRVVQRMLEHGTEQDKEDLMMELHNSAQVLITDQYGNYVTQHVIQHGKPEDRSRMIQLVTAQLVTLSKHKFASNVVEKCIEHGSPEDRQRIREQLTAQGSDGTSPLQLMMKDQYGNYVIQKLLTQLSGMDRDALIEEMKPQFTSLKKVSSGRQIAAIDRLIFAAGAPAPTKPGSSGSLTSATPTPILTMETNSPQSSSPPSTNASAVGEVAEENEKAQLANGGASLKVQVQES